MISLGFLLLFRFLDRPSVGRGALFGLGTALLSLTSLYYGAVWIIAVVVMVLGWLIWRRFAVTRQLVTGFVVAVAAAALFVGPVAFEYLRARPSRSQVRIFNSGYWLHVRDFFTLAPSNWLYGHCLDGLGNTRAGEHSFFLGFTVLVLALVGIAALAWGPSIAPPAPTVPLESLVASASATSVCSPPPESSLRCSPSAARPALSTRGCIPSSTGTSRSSTSWA